jgi:hypothetical protein
MLIVCPFHQAHARLAGSSCFGQPAGQLLPHPIALIGASDRLYRPFSPDTTVTSRAAKNWTGGSVRLAIPPPPPPLIKVAGEDSSMYMLQEKLVLVYSRHICHDDDSNFVVVSIGSG